MATTTDIGAMISISPEICGGRPRISGTGVSVRTVVGYYSSGETPAEIATQIPHLSLAQVHAALAYYYANRDQMDAAMAVEKAEAERLEAEFRVRD